MALTRLILITMAIAIYGLLVMVATEVITGIDVLTGAAGADHFVYQQVPSDEDVITDFEPESDMILVSASASGFGGGITTGLPSVRQFVVGNTAKDAGDRFIYNSVNGTGNSPAALIATLKNQPNFARDNLEIYP